MNELESLVDGGYSLHAKCSSINEHADPLITWKTSQKDFVFVYAAITIQVITAAFLIVATFTNIPIQYDGSLSPSDRSLYVTGTTVIASVISVFTSTQITRLWLSKLLPHPRFAKTVPQARLEKVWSLLGIGEYLHQFKYWTFNGSFLITGLITTAIVAGISPTIGERREPSSSSFYVNDKSDCLVYSRDGVNEWFNWRTGKDAFISLKVDQRTACATQHAVGMLNDITYTPTGYAYTAAGIPIHRSAIGTPFKYAGGGTGFYDTFGVRKHYSDFRQAEQCLPVVTKNPVQCRKGGIVTAGGNNVSVNTRDCDITTPIFKVNPIRDGATALGACTGSRDIGKATILLGAVNSHAPTLASVMGDKGGVVKTQNSDQPPYYSVICDVDIAPSIDFRTVNFLPVISRFNTRQDLAEKAKRFGATFIISSDWSLCTPQSSSKKDTHTVDIATIMNNSTLAIGASASWQLLTEHDFRDGWWPTLFSITQQHNGTSTSISDIFVFNDSRNALEDALGLTSAAVLSNFWASPYGSEGRNLNFTSGSTMTTGVRVGPGETWALIYAIPEIWAIGILIWLTGMKKRENKKTVQ